MAFWLKVLLRSETDSREESSWANVPVFNYSLLGGGGGGEED